MGGTVPVIEVFADVGCPFAHVGLRRLVARRAALNLDFTLHVRAWPLELVNAGPFDPEFIAEEVDALREQVAPDLFAGFDPARFPASSLPAFSLTAAAYERDRSVGEEVALALRWALFEEGRDVASPDVLDEIAHGAGLPSAITDDGSVHGDWEDGRARGVIGSPHFFLAGEGYFDPALDISREGGRLRIVDNRAVFDAFVERAVAG